MLKFLFALFILLPLAELYLLIEVGSGIGGFSTIALCLLTAAIGGILVRIQGMQTLLQSRQMIEQGQAPAEPMLHGMMIAASGVMLFVPGFITDIIGFALLVPFVRSAIGHWVISRFMTQQRQGSKVIIEAEVIDSDKHKLP